MILIKTLEQAWAHRHKGELHNGCVYWRSDYFDTDSPASEQPQAYLVEQAPHSTVPPHFHAEDQFQVVVRGTGHLGRHAVGPLAVHFTNAYTGYGPITAAAEGLDYFTLRARSDGGARFLPDARREQKKVPRRHLLSADTVPLGGMRLAGLESSRAKPLLEEQPGGPAAWVVRMGPGIAGDPPSREQGGGRFLVVIDGTLTHGDATLSRWCCMYIPPDETAPDLRAGSSGLEALWLQFPSAR